jgi:hypothetical protein
MASEELIPDLLRKLGVSKPRPSSDAASTACSALGRGGDVEDEQTVFLGSRSGRLPSPFLSGCLQEP